MILTLIAFLTVAVIFGFHTLFEHIERVEKKGKRIVPQPVSHSRCDHVLNALGAEIVSITSRLNEIDVTLTMPQFRNPDALHPDLRQLASALPQHYRKLRVGDAVRMSGSDAIGIYEGMENGKCVVRSSATRTSTWDRAQLKFYGPKAQ